MQVLKGVCWFEVCAHVQVVGCVESPSLDEFQVEEFNGWIGSWARKALSNLSMNRFAYEGAIFVPIADLFVDFAIEANTLHLRTMSKSWRKTFLGMWRNDGKRSVGPLQPLTIGLIPWGFLWSFLRKYIRCVLTLSVGCRQACVCVYVASFFHAVHFFSCGFCYGGCRIRV